MSVDRVADALMVAGAAWALIAAVGVLRFDDVYSRMHAATKAATGGLLLVLAGGWFVIDHTAAIITIGLWAGMTLLAIGATQAAAAIAVWRAAKNS